MKSKYLLAIGLTLSHLSHAQAQNNFTEIEVSLAAGQAVGSGLSMALRGEQPSLSVITNSGQLLFLSQQDGVWNQSVVDEGLSTQLYTVSDSLQSSHVYLHGMALIAYFDEVNGCLKLAQFSNDEWIITTVDGGGGNAVGAYPEMRVLADGRVAICYQDVSNNDLKWAVGTPHTGFELATLSTTGGAWCSFYDDDSILFSEADQVYIARSTNGVWQTSSTGMSGTQPTGGTSLDGTREMYASQPKSSWTSLNESDLALQNLWHPLGGEEFIGDFFNNGACPDFEPNVGVAYREIVRSALFGSSVSIYAFLKDNGSETTFNVSTYSAGGLPTIRCVDLEKTRQGNFRIAYTYSLHNSFQDKEVIKIASRATAAPTYTDSDADEIDDAWEITRFGNLGTAGAGTDADSDQWSDRDEFIAGTDPLDSDSDDDGVADGVESLAGYDPLDSNQAPGSGNPDDMDGLDDSWELSYFGNTDAGPDEDPDSDGLDNIAEYELGTHPLVSDSDADGYLDGYEVSLAFSAIDATHAPRFAISMTKASSSLELRVPSRLLHQYQLQTSLDLTEWTAESEPLSGNGGDLLITAQPSAGQSFYRVQETRVEP
ncbi:MAG: hypothetical protein ACO3RV_07575 [Luteolibacter sp.]